MKDISDVGWRKKDIADCGFRMAEKDILDCGRNTLRIADGLKKAIGDRLTTQSPQPPMGNRTQHLNPFCCLKLFSIAYCQGGAVVVGRMADSPGRYRMGGLPITGVMGWVERIAYCRGGVELAGGAALILVISKKS